MQYLVAAGIALLTMLGTSAKAASVAPSTVIENQAAPSAAVQKVYDWDYAGRYGWHNRWRSHYRWGSHGEWGGGWHNCWRSHYRWGSRGWGERRWWR